MKNKFYVLVSMFMFVSVTAFSANAQTDLSMRTALYFTGAKTDKIDLKNDKYVVAGETMQLSKSQATKCEGDICEFNIGFIAFRTITKGALSTYGLLKVENGGLSGNTIYFADEEEAKQGVFPLQMKMGINKVTFTIDPYNKTVETRKVNNSFSVHFNVISATVPMPRKIIKVAPRNGKP